MATLTLDSLLGCFFIPSFIPSGSKTTFENSSAPISWTKDSTPNNATLRIINGSISSNLLNQTFSSVFSNRSLSYSVSPNPSGTVTVNPSPAGVSLSPTSPAISFQPAIFGTGLHTHEYQDTNVIQRRSGTQVPNAAFGSFFTPSGSSSSHAHSVTASPTTHNHTAGGVHDHLITDSAHNHTSSTFPQNFSINYKDFIIATKD